MNLLLILVSGLEIVLVSRLKIGLILMEIGLMSLSSILMWKLLSWMLRTRLTPRKIRMIPPSRIVCLGVRIIIGSGVGCIYTVREYLLSLVYGQSSNMWVKSWQYVQPRLGIWVGLT